MEVSQGLKDAVEYLKKVNFQSLKRPDLGRDYSFDESAPLLEKITIDLINLTSDPATLRLPNATEKQIEEIANRAKQAVDRITTFVLKGNESNAPHQHQNIVSLVEEAYQKSLATIQPLLERKHFLDLAAGLDPSSIKLKLTEIEEARQKSIGYSKESEKTLQDLRENFGKKGAGISEQHFESQATQYKKVANYWLGAIIVSITFALILAFVLYRLNVQDNYFSLIHSSILRIVLLSIAYLFIYQSIKNYKANHHLYVLNRHRQLALDIYPFMLKAASNPEHSNIILQHAAKAIFDSGSTGYIDNEESSPPINLTSIINKASEQK